MSNYIGVRCPVCDKKFANSDDVVVCPVCGAPHHRQCYLQGNECKFSADHLSGKEWQNPLVHIANTAASTSNCQNCGANNISGALICTSCNTRLSPAPTPHPTTNASGVGQGAWSFPPFDTTQQTQPIYGGLNPDETIEGETVRDLSLYIGDNSFYFLTRFKRFSQSNNAFSFNLPALVLGFYYYIYRKQYLVGAVLLVLFIVGMIPNFLYSIEALPTLLHQYGLIPQPEVNQAALDHFSRLNTISFYMNFSLRAIISFCANNLYYNSVVNSVKKIRINFGENRNENDYCATLVKEGGTNKKLVTAVVIVVVLAYIAVSMVVASSFLKTIM